MPLRSVFDQHQRLADLHHGGGVGDVLRGRAPMAPLAEPVAAERHQLLHDGQHRITDALGRVFSLSKSISAALQWRHDFLGGVLRNDAEPRLRPRQRRLEIEVFLHAVLVGEYPPHRLGGENVAEHGGVDQGRGHSSLRRISSCAHSRDSGAPPVRDLMKSGVRDDPGSAAHHFAPHRAALRPGNAVSGLTKWICEAQPPKLAGMTMPRSARLRCPGAAARLANIRRRRIPALFRRRDGAPPRRDRGAAQGAGPIISSSAAPTVSARRCSG